MELEKDKTTTEQVTIKLTGDDILSLLAEGGHIPAKPDLGAKVSFTVPGGGDWSNMSVDIDKDNVIRVAYKQTWKET
jgi:hypothetical protein